MITELNFEKISKRVKNSTAKPRKPVNLSETTRDITVVHQRAADSLQSFQCFFLLSQPDPSSVMTY